VLGVVLAVVGVYGVVAQLARSRLREMGIRIALGARGRTVQWLIVRRGLRIASVGIAVGGVGSLFGSRVLARLLYGVAPNDTATLASVVIALVVAALLASWIPALRAGRVDPVAVLREE